MKLGESDPARVASIREELTQLGVAELRTAEAVDEADLDRGTVLVLVHALDEASAELARPALAYALQHDRLPERVVAVFAGQDLDAAARARAHFRGYFPTAPQIGLLEDGEVVCMCDRDDLLRKHREVDAVVAELTAAFDRLGSPAREPGPGRGSGPGAA